MSSAPEGAGTAADRWRDALAAWAVPQEILDGAPEPPWGFSPRLFACVAERALAEPDSVSRRVAREALPDGGSVLDVGVGGGAASLPLAPPAGLLVGVDQGEEMLATFARAADARGVAHREVQGSWPEVAGEVEDADVVVCHNVVYNVPDLAPFVRALADRARRRVVIELTSEHPTAHLRPLWRDLHGLERPTSPTAAEALEVLSEMGLRVGHEVWERRWTGLHPDRSEMIASFRRRLCLGPDRDADIDALLTPEVAEPVRQVVTVWFEPRGRGSL